MILELKIDGYRFFKKDTKLSFGADARTKKLLANAAFLDGRYVNKSLAIYGANNSGKSNLIRLFEVLKTILSGKDSFVLNRALFKDEVETSIEIIFNNLDGKGWLKYGFLFDNRLRKFKREFLYCVAYYPNGAPFEKTIFEKDIANKIFVIFGEDYSRYLDVINSSLPLLHSIELDSGTFASLREYKQSLEALANSIEIFDMYNIPLSKTIDFMKNANKEKREFVLAFVKNADLSVQNFEYDPEGVNVEALEKGKVEENALALQRNLIDSLCLKTTYGHLSVPSFLFDSSGTKKIEAIASYIYEAIKEGKTLIVDELDNGLHFRLTRAIVAIFNNLSNTKGQLVFTAHDLLLIDCNNLMRKDQIYFLERDDRYARLFCLKEATVSSGGPREGADLIKRYNHGDFVEVPSPDFIRLIIKMKTEGSRNE